MGAFFLAGAVCFALLYGLTNSGHSDRYLLPLAILFVPLLEIMLADCTYYPATCRPEDIVFAMKRIRMQYFYADVPLRGEYPGFMLRYFKENDIHVDITEADKALLKKIHWISWRSRIIIRAHSIRRRTRWTRLRSVRIPT